MRYSELVDDFKKRSANIKELKKQLREEINHHRGLSTKLWASFDPALARIKEEYTRDIKAMIKEGDTKPDDATLVELKEKARQYKEKLSAIKSKYMDGFYGKEKVKLNQEVCHSSKKIRQLEKMIADESRKNMHLHIALGLFRGTPLNKIITPTTRIKIRPESVFEFLSCITEK